MSDMFSTTMSAADQAMTKMVADTLNKEILGGRQAKASLDKDDFLKILITQLQHQDPTQPMEDKEFIAQMAQFSSLEQMTNMSQNFTKMAGMLKSSEASGLLGKTVEVVENGVAATGMVQKVLRGDYPQIVVNGKAYDADSVTTILQ